MILSFLTIMNAIKNPLYFTLDLGGTTIYLMLADCYAILSIFIIAHLGKNIFTTYVVTFISLVVLFSLNSRASLYCFIFVVIIQLFKNHKIFLLLMVTFIGYMFYFTNYAIIEDARIAERMINVVIGNFDKSQYLRSQLLIDGLHYLKQNWLLGGFMTEIKENQFGISGQYIHNYLSFWRQFGFFPFLIIIFLISKSSYLIIKNWFINSKDKYSNFIFMFNLFVLCEIIIARSYISPFIWLSISASFIFQPF